MMPFLISVCHVGIDFCCRCRFMLVYCWPSMGLLRKPIILATSTFKNIIWHSALMCCGLRLHCEHFPGTTLSTNCHACNNFDPVWLAATWALKHHKPNVKGTIQKSCLGMLWMRHHGISAKLPSRTLNGRLRHWSCIQCRESQLSNNPTKISLITLLRQIEVW